MTHPILGRAVPIQFEMVALAGWGQNSPSAAWRDIAAADYGLIRDDTLAAQ